MKIRVQTVIVAVVVLVTTALGVAAQEGSVADAGYASGVTAAQLRASLND